VNGQAGPSQAGGGRLVMGTGTCITLIVVGAVLRFAVHKSSTHGLNVHVVGVILILAGVLGLVLSLLVWGRSRNRRPRGYDSGAPPVVEEHRVYMSQPPAVEERRVYRDESPAVEQRRLYRDQPPL
jgi:uncharacterized protein DUF6458